MSILVLELDRKVFGKITTKEIIGAEPPAKPDTLNVFEKELEILLSDLKSQTKGNLEKLLENQYSANTLTADQEQWLLLRIKFRFLMILMKSTLMQ